MRILTLDFETYYDREYSLRRLTTEAYVRDSRFKAHMLGFKVGDGPVAVHRDVAGFCAKVDWPQVAALAHHSQFDGLILSHHYGVRPKLWLDMLSMARIVLPGEKHSLHALAQRLGMPTVEKHALATSLGVRDLGPLFDSLGEDCKRDVELTYACAMKLLPFVPRAELLAIDLTIRMFTEPVLELDRDRLEIFHRKVVAEKTSTLERLGVTKAELQSSEKFAALLRAVGVEPPLKANPKGEMIYAFAKTDDGMRDLEEHIDGRVQSITAARLGSKSTLDETRSERLVRCGARGPLTVYLRHSGAHTGRWSGGDKLNWQNFPRGGEIRKCVVAPPGKKLVIGDLSQIECRIVNWLAGQSDVLENFRRNADIYSALASRFYGRAISRADVVERHLGKTIELGCGFGMGMARFRDTCRRGPLGGAPIVLDERQAQDAINLYRSTHQNVVALWKQGDTVLWALAGGHSTIWGPCKISDRAIWLPGGYPLWYRNITQQDGDKIVWNGKAWVKLYGAKLVENVVQALAAVILKEAMLRIASHYRIALTVHDDIMAIADQDDDQAADFIRQEMARVPEWASGLPLDVEVMEGVRYEK